MPRAKNISTSQQVAVQAPARASKPRGSHTSEGAHRRYLFRSIMHGITTAVMVVALVLAAALVGVRLVGFDVYTVLSGSMEPTYHTGSVIYVKPCEPEEVQVGDPITFVLNEDLVVATHRVIDIDAEEGAFYTKGDANAAADGSPVLFENLIGKPMFSIPYLGYIASYVQEPPGTYVAVAVCAVLIMLTFIPDLFAKDEDEEEESKGKKQKKAKRGKGDEGAKPEPQFQSAHAVAQGTRVAEAPARQRQARVVPNAQQPVGQPAQQVRQTNVAPIQQRQAAVRAQAQRQASMRQSAPGAAQSNNPRLRQQAYQQQRASSQVASAAQAQARDLESYPQDGARQDAGPRRQRRSL